MNFDEIKGHCDQHSAISKTVVDEFLIYYAAKREKLVPVMDGYLKKYKSVAHELEGSHINFLKAEYIAHRIFRKGGYLGKYLHHAEIKNLSAEKYEFLEFQHQHPWRYSFAEIINNPSQNFFEMEDVMTGERYLLYSPGMQGSENEYHPRLWFNLIGFNGMCWQTFGLVIFFKCFDLDDLFFFATELNPQIEDEESLMKLVEENPFPFFMLLAFSAYPVIDARGFESRLCLALDPVENFSTEGLSKHFTIEWNKNVYQLKSKRDGEFPHFAIAWYEEKEKILVRSASTLEGFDSLSKTLIKAGYALDPEADIVVSLPMVTAAEKILGKKIELHPYSKLFEIKKPGGDKELKKLNHFLSLTMPYFNNNQEPDIPKLAKEAGIDPVTAASIWEQTKLNVEDQKRRLL